MIKKVALVTLVVVFLFTGYQIENSNLKESSPVDFSAGETPTSTIKKAEVVDGETIYSKQALQIKDDHTGTYKDEESTWTSRIVGTVGLLSGKIQIDDRTGLWWTDSSQPNTITNNFDIDEKDGTRITGGNAVAFCEGLNKALFGGKNDWYLPTQKELMQAYIDGIYSQDPKFASTDILWSSSELANNPKKAWYVGTSYGFVFIGDKTTPYSVRCVRREVSTPDKSIYASQALQTKDDHSSAYKDEESTWANMADGKIGKTNLSSGKIRKDERTGLWWSASSKSISITNQLDLDAKDGTRITGGNAVAFCEGLNKALFGGKNDWYLPTQKELMQAYIDGIYSQDPKFASANNFWSSTLQPSYDPDLIWYVNVSNGNTLDFIWSTPCAVRCVRRD